MKPIYFVVFALFCSSCSYAQTISRFKITLDRDPGNVAVPLSADLDQLTLLPATSFRLVEEQAGKTAVVPHEVSTNGKRVLHWLVGGAKGDHFYRLEKTVPAKQERMTAVKGDSTLVLRAGNQPLVSYYYKTKYPPAGQDTNYKRSGFIHPVWTPHGQVLTRVQAPDHYHHYGIWNPWTHVFFEGDTVDFWNIKGRQGTVRFARLISSTGGQVYSEFKVLHEHVVFKRNGSEKVALNEIQTVRTYSPSAANDYYIMDVTSEMTCASESPFKIVAYRYAGLGWRTTEFWNNNNCEVLTSEGKTRKNTDGTKARWAIVQGELPGQEYGGMAWLSNPSNYNHPEPIRIWVENTNGRGDMFFNFAPTKDKDWLLEPGKTYSLTYRMVVFNGRFDAAKVEAAWHYFAEPPKITVNK